MWAGFIIKRLQCYKKLISEPFVLAAFSMTHRKIAKNAMEKANNDRKRNSHKDNRCSHRGKYTSSLIIRKCL